MKTEPNPCKPHSSDVLLLPGLNDQPWSTIDSIRRLCEFAEMKLYRDGYDGDHWEELQAAATVVRQVIKWRDGDEDEPK